MLVFKQTVWLSTGWDDEQGTQSWRIYRRPGKGLGPWWSGLIPKGTAPHEMRNTDLPTPVLRAYAYTEWSWDEPQLPDGTDLWVQHNAPNQFEIWYSELNWPDFLNTGEQGWAYLGIGYHEPGLAPTVVGLSR